VGALAVAVGGCAAGGHGGGSGQAPWVGAGGPAPETRDELLVATGDAVWRGDLGAAHAALTRLADREHGLPDTALDFWSELLALLRCEPLARTPRVARDDRPLRDPWDALRRLVQIERVRLGRRSGAGTAAQAATRIASAEGGGAATGRRPLDVVWPIEREHWSDELPTPAVVSRCLAEPSAERAGSSLAPPSGPEVAFVLQAARLMPDGHPAKPILLVEAAALAIADGRPGGAAGPLAKLEAGPSLILSSVERDEALLAAALAAIGDPSASPETLLARGRQALALPLDAPVRRAVALRLADRLVQAGRGEDATAVLGPPPHGDDDIGRYIAFRQVEAHARAGRRAELLAEAREVLHRTSRAAVDEDPALAAVMDVALRALLASPVSAETLEMIEALGPPRERLARAEAFAQIALEAGAHPSAMATFLWLYENDTDPSRQLQHLARASVAAARAGNRAEFARTFRLLAGQEDLGPARAAAPKRGERSGPQADAAPRAGDRSRADGRPDDKLRVAGRPTDRPRDGALISSGEVDRAREKRRESRSVNWQRALLVVARDALPALVDADDQSNLSTLVDTLKRHLGDGGRGPVDEELTTLYRAASAHLKSGARAYAETIGSDRRPILLGDVLVGRSYDVRPPRVDLRSAVGEAGPLVFVPKRGNDPTTSLERWPGRFGLPWPGGRS
jgi:hypothetical protein